MHNKANYSQDLEIDLKQLANLFWKKKWYICKIAAIFLVFGFIIAISIPKEYTCTVKMAPEGSKTSITGDMSSLAAIAGISLGTGNADGINFSLYPDIVQSMPFMTEMINITIKDNKFSNSTLYNYLDTEIKQPWWTIVFSYPFKLLAVFQAEHEKEQMEINSYKLTKQQEKIINSLKSRINVSIDKKTGVISAGVTLQDPALSAKIADSLVSKLERYIIDYKTNKARKDFSFATKIFAEARQNYFEKQKNYARYIDENKNIILESVKIEQERLKNEQSLAYNIYTSLSQQVDKARMKVQEQTPSVTIIEPARVPTKKSNTSGLTILFWFAILGGVVSILKVLFLRKVKA